MKKNIRRWVALCLAITLAFLCVPAITTYASENTTVLVVRTTGSTTRKMTVTQIAPMDHFQGVSETLGTSQTVTLFLQASYDACYYAEGLEAAMNQLGMYEYYSRTYNGIYYTLDSTLPSGYYRVQAVFSCKKGYWEVGEHTGDIAYAPTGTISFAPVAQY